MTRFVRMRHPATGGEADIPERGVATKQSSGWQLVEPPDDTPAASDRKSVWIDHAVASGADRHEAEAAAKGELIDRYGG